MSECTITAMMVQPLVFRAKVDYMGSYFLSSRLQAETFTEMQWSELQDQTCSIARTLSVIGDRWTLMILRECFLKVRRFEDFQTRLGIGRPILADRLQILTEAFVLTKVVYQTNPVRQEYRLTEKGLDLYPIVMSIVHWGDIHMSGKKGRPLLHRHLNCGHIFDPVMVCSECREDLHARDVKVETGPGARGLNHLPMDAVKNPPARISRPRKKAAAGA